MVEPFLDGMTLEDAMKYKKIYIVNLDKLTDVKCRYNRLVSYGNYCCLKKNTRLRLSVVWNI